MGTENDQVAPVKEPVESPLREHTNELLSDLGSEAEIPEPGAVDVDAQAVADEAARKARDEKGRFTSATKPADEAKPTQAAKPTPEQPEPVVEEVEPEGGWKAEAQRLRDQSQRQHTGFQRTLQELRQSARQQPFMPQLPQQQQAPQPAQPQARLPIEFDEQGQPFVPVSAMQPLLQQMAPRPQPMDAATIRRTMIGRFQQEVINRDPVANAPVVNRLVQAIEHADQMVAAKQQEIGGYTFPTMDSVLDFMEGTGIAGVLREQYPDLLAAPEDLETLVEGAMTVNHRKLERLLVKARMTSAGVPAAPRTPAQLRALPASKPRSQASRGSPEALLPGSREAKLAAIDAKNPLDWTKEETKEYQKLLKDAG